MMALTREAVVAAAVVDAPKPIVPLFLMHSRNAEKRPCMEQANTPFTAFQPSWGICESDTISLSLSSLWSGHIILSPRLIMLLLFAAGGLMRPRCLEQMAFVL